MQVDSIPTDAVLRPRRNQAIELLRLVAIFGVVAFHSPVPGRQLTYAGLAAFVVLSAMLDVQVNWERRRSVRDLARTLLVPWLFWLVAYAALRLLDGKPMLKLEDGVVSAVLAGTAPHLWFLPFIFVALTLVNLAKGRIGARVMLVVTATTATVLLVSVGVWRELELPPPWGRWLHAAPLFVVGLSLGLMTRVPHGFVLVLPVAIGIAMVGFEDIPGVSVSYVVGTTAVLLARWVGPKLPPSFEVESLSRCVMGTYLAHVVSLTLAWPLLVRFGYPAVIVAFVATLGSVWLMRRFLPRTRAVL